MIATEKRTVRGKTSTGKRPHINYMGSEYRSPLLDESSFLIGTELTLQVNLDDLRVIKAFLPDGTEFGKLVVQGKWSLYPHNWELRSTILKLKNKGLIRFGANEDPIEVYHRYLEETAPHQRISRNRLVQLDNVYSKELESQETSGFSSSESNPSSTMPERRTQSEPRLFRTTLNN